MNKFWKKFKNWILGRGFTAGTGIFTVPKGVSRVHITLVGGGGGGSGIELNDGNVAVDNEGNHNGKTETAR